MSDASGSHDLVQTAGSRSLSPPRFLTLAQLGVEAPNCDQQNYVADEPEKAKQAESGDHQVPKFQVTQLHETRREVNI